MMGQQAPDPQRFGDEAYEKPLSELVKDLSREMSVLVRQEMELAKTELTEKGKRAGIGAGLLGGAALVALLALGALTACLILALANVMDPAVAALIVSLGFLSIAGIMAASGRSKIKQAGPPAPEETAESVKEDVRWLKGQRP